MAKSTLKTDFKDDILSPNMGGKRKYRMIQNEDGTVSFEDVTEYTQTGSNFGSKQVNETNLAVNNSVDKADVIENIEDIAANVTQGKVAGALAVRELNSNFVESKIWKLHTSKTGSDVIILPETYGELLVYVKTESSHIWTSNIPFGAPKGYIRTGCDGEKIVWNYGAAKINLITCNADGVSLINKATTYVYYR